MNYSCLCVAGFLHRKYSVQFHRDRTWFIRYDSVIFHRIFFVHFIKSVYWIVICIWCGFSVLPFPHLLSSYRFHQPIYTDAEQIKCICLYTHCSYLLMDNIGTMLSMCTQNYDLNRTPTLHAIVQLRHRVHFIEWLSSIDFKIDFSFSFNVQFQCHLIPYKHIYSHNNTHTTIEPRLLRSHLLTFICYYSICYYLAGISLLFSILSINKWYHLDFYVFIGNSKIVHEPRYHKFYWILTYKHCSSPWVPSGYLQIISVSIQRAEHILLDQVCWAAKTYAGAHWTWVINHT